MNAIRARLMMLAAGLALARLAAWGVMEVTPEGALLLRWLDHTLELLLFLLDAWLEPRMDLDADAARRAEVEPLDPPHAEPTPAEPEDRS